MVAASVPRVVLQHGVGNVAVRNELNRAVVVAQLLFGQHVRTVTLQLFLLQLLEPGLLFTDFSLDSYNFRFFGSPNTS